MNLKNLIKLFGDRGCRKVYVKRLSPNDNSKNQVYLGGGFEVLNILPIAEIRSEPVGDWNRERFKASMNFEWIGEDGLTYPAPNAQLILYPKYPEVRFSGFLLGCQNAPNHIMAQRAEGRILFLGVTNDGRILGFAEKAGDELTNEFLNQPRLDTVGVFQVLETFQHRSSRDELISEMRRIHAAGWIDSKRLDKEGNIVSCDSPNCGGYTLEAELGIRPNGYSEPDFMGWEVKQFNVNGFNAINNSVITLMTPEPTGGYYAEEGVEKFIRKYGYEDQMGRDDRLNFGGIHKYSQKHERTGLKLDLPGYDAQSEKIRNSDGRICLLDSESNEAASWSFSSLIKHWNRKHNQACYVPSLSRKDPPRQYQYGNRLILGTGTDFLLFLKQMSAGNIYYDPGIKLENASSNPRVKRRSQFRIKSLHLNELYKAAETVNINI